MPSCWSWCQSLLCRDLLPDRRVVVRFRFTHSGRRLNLWMLLERGECELCRFDPGFGDDLVVTIEDAVAFARWHLGGGGMQSKCAGHRMEAPNIGHVPDLAAAPRAFQLKCWRGEGVAAAKASNASRCWSFRSAEITRSIEASRSPAPDAAGMP